MASRTVLFRSQDERWLEFTVGDDRATARVGGPCGSGEPFSFSLENLGYVANGIGYQAWGDGSHFNFRREPMGVAVEFQSPHDRGMAVCHLSNEALRANLDDLGVRSPIAARASLV